MVVSFARVIVGSQLITFHTAAEIRFFSIGTLLRTKSRRIAFVDILARKSVRLQLLPAWTQTQRPVGGLLAVVRTEARSVFTSCKITAWTCKKD